MVAANAKLIAARDNIVNNVLSFFIILSSPRGHSPLCLDCMEMVAQAQGYKGNGEDLLFRFWVNHEKLMS